MEDPVLGEETKAFQKVEEAVVETVEEKYVPHIQPPIQPLSWAEYLWYSTLNYFSNPWAFLILLYLLYRVYRWISPMEKREQAAEAAAMKKDPDAYRAKMEAMEAARMRMQEKYNQDADAEQLKREEAESLRREQDIKDWEEHQRGGGYKNRAPAKVDKEREALEQQARVKGKKGFAAPPPRTDFNPLMGGGGGGSGYRPPARRGGGG